MKKTLKATKTLIEAGGACRNRCQFADMHYRTERGHRSRKYTYRAVDRSIKAGQIRLRGNGEIELTTTTTTQGE